MRDWDVRRWLTAAVASVGCALLVGVPTAVVPSPLFTREIPTPWWGYPVWLCSAVLGGLLLATYTPTRRADARDTTGSRFGLGGGVLTWLAVGCPLCNKLVLLAVGSAGALSWFQPIQPVLAVASLVLLAVALRVRLRGQRSCPVPRRRLGTVSSGGAPGSEET